MEFFAVIPVHNESKNVQEVIQKVKKLTPNVIVVDDGSIDNTAEIAEAEGVTVLSHKVNLGKGAALKTGCDFAVRSGAKNLVVLDGDGQHAAEEIPLFIEKLAYNDIVFGCRQQKKRMPFVLKFGNNFINWMFTALYGLKVEDTQSGYRAFTSEAYKKIRWQASDYFMETEMMINTKKYGLKYIQIPIRTIYADKYKGTTVFDGIKIVSRLIGGRILK